MIRKVRTKVASSISKINEVDDFNFTGWLKKPLLYEHQVESIDSDLGDTSEITTEIDEVGNADKDFVLIEPNVKDAFPQYSFPKVRSNAIFFMIAAPLENFIFYPDPEKDKIDFSERSYKFLLPRPSFKKVDVLFDDVIYKDYECVIPTPESRDYLQEIIPKIINIDIKSFNDLMSEDGKGEIFAFKLEPFKKSKIAKQPLPELPKLKKIYKVKIPSIGKFNFTQKDILVPGFDTLSISNPYPATFAKVKNYFANVKFSKIDYLLMYSSAKEVKDKKVSADNEDSKEDKKTPSLREELKLILSNIKKVDWDKNKNIQIKLRDYEEAAAKFLVESDFALLQDELGIDSEKEVIAALKVLLKNRIIKSVLILTSENKKGYRQLGNQLYMHSGWIDKLAGHCPEFLVSNIIGSDKEKAGLWNKSTPIIVSSLENAVNDFYFKTLTQARLEKFDCIVLDNAHLISSTGEKGKKFATSIKPKTLWAVSNQLNQQLQKELNDLFSPSIEIDKTLVRGKASITIDAPKIIWNEMWVEADDNQVKEFKDAMTDCKKELKRVLESENPLRFTANIYTLLHRLNQLGNFSSNKTKSPKADLLIEHVSTIQSNGKKVLILSQYDRQGTKKLSELLTSSGIKQITVQGGSPVDDINKAIELFKSRDDISAFIADSKSTKIKHSDLGVSYVIKFDQWWNPVNSWESEDIFYSDSKVDESINFFNYYSLGTIDEKVRELLSNHELLNRNVFELMQPKVFEELIAVEDWLKVFEMPVSEEDKNELQTEKILKQINATSVVNFRKLLTRFFSLLGYSNLDVIEGQDSYSFNILGKGQRNKRTFSLVARVFFKPEVDKKILEEILVESSKSVNDKIFLITRGEFPELSEKILQENLTMLDGLTLANYLFRLGIAKADS